jgi:hypothetical protein
METGYRLERQQSPSLMQTVLAGCDDASYFVAATALRVLASMIVEWVSMPQRKGDSGTDLLVHAKAVEQWLAVSLPLPTLDNLGKRAVVHGEGPRRCAELATLLLRHEDGRQFLQRGLARRLISFLHDDDRSVRTAVMDFIRAVLTCGTVAPDDRWTNLCLFMESPMPIGRESLSNDDATTSENRSGGQILEGLVEDLLTSRHQTSFMTGIDLLETVAQCCPLPSFADARISEASLWLKRGWIRVLNVMPPSISLLRSNESPQEGAVEEKKAELNTRNLRRDWALTGKIIDLSRSLLQAHYYTLLRVR